MVTITDSAIALYNIELDGSVNGVYTNIPAHGIIFNEIVRKIERESNLDEVSGDYTCSWIDENNTRHGGILRITPRVNHVRTNPDRNRILNFQWLEGDLPNENLVYVGIGYQMNQHQIAVHYWSSREIQS